MGRPVLWRSELRNVLALYLRKSLISFEDALKLAAEAEALLEGNEYEVSAHDVLALVSASPCSAYDCEFVALAQSLDVKLVTMDKKLIAAFPDRAVSLNDFMAGPD